MNSNLKLILGITSLAAVIIGASFAYTHLSVSYAPEKISTEAAVTPADISTEADGEDMPAPDFTVVDIDGNELRLSDFFGKPVVLNFWASWCPPCKAELPDFDRVYLELSGDVTFLMVDLVDGHSETIEKGSKYIEENGYSFPVYYDTTQEAAYAYSISSIPSTLFIDSEGNVVAGHQGQMSEAMLREGISMIYTE